MDRLILREDAAPTVEGRTVTIRIATYNKVYSFGGKRERIKPGAFKEALARPRASLRFRHIGERPGDSDSLDDYYGWLKVLREEGDALIGDFEVFEGSREDKLLTLITTGTVTGASMAALVKEAIPTRDPLGTVTDILRIGAMDGVSITPSPAYSDAGVLAVRESRVTAERLAQERAWWAKSVDRQ